MELHHHIPGRARFRITQLPNLVGMSEWLKQGLLSLQGVQSVRVNEHARSVVVQYDHKLLSPEEVEQRFADIDWSNVTFGDSEHEFSRGDIALNVFGTLATLFLPGPLGALATLPLIAPTLEQGVNELRSNRVTVEVLDALAVGLSAWRGDYRTAMLTQSLLTMGEYMEQQTSRHSDALLADLMRPRQELVWRLKDGTEEQISSDELAQGDVIVLSPGDGIPVDGHIRQGTALVNQASLTGESVPVRREVGAYVYAGTQIQEGRIEVCIDKIGAEATTARIAQLIMNALAEKSETQEATQKMADRRVKITLGIGTLVFALTRDFERLASVFLVDYSCALKLSTPVTFKSIMYRAAQEGLLLKGGRAVEKLVDIDTCVFDKTGTLTHGKMEVTDVVGLAGDNDARDLLAIAASVEEHCNHPLSQAVVNAAQNHELPHIEHGEVDYIIAHGLRSTLKDQNILIGSRHFLEAHEEVDFSPYEDLIEELERKGRHILFIASDQQPACLIGLSDQLREDARQTLDALRAAGVNNLVLLTGDTEAKAHKLAAELGMNRVFANATPETKADVVKGLQKAGHKVLFIGDGVNDAPALTQAEVGLAMGSGTELAQQAADVVSLNDQLYSVAKARIIAQQAMKLINSNIRLTEVVNSAIMLAASLGLLSPAASALLHNGTTMAVLARSIAARSAPTA